MSDFTPRAETYAASRAFVTVNNTNLSTTYGMNLTDYDVGTPIPDIKLIAVAGRPGKLDATLALNGKVNYISRPISATFHVRNCTYPRYNELLSTLLRLFNGTESKVVFSTDPDWFYRGRFTIDKKKSNPITATISLVCNEAFPYKLQTNTEESTITDTGDVVCTGLEYNGNVTINASAVMQVTFGGTTYELARGNNVIREIHLVNGRNTLRFTGTGTVRITYERGVQ